MGFSFKSVTRSRIGSIQNKYNSTHLPFERYPASTPKTISMTFVKMFNGAPLRHQFQIRASRCRTRRNLGKHKPIITMVYALTCLQKYTRVTLNFTNYDDYNIVAYTYCVHFTIIRFLGYITILIILIKLI